VCPWRVPPPCFVLASAILPHATPTVHAVVVHRRGDDLLARCLESLLASQGVDLRVAVVANVCEEPLPSLAETHSRVHVLRSAVPLGFAAAGKRGASFLRERAGAPDHLYFVNDDTVSEPDALRELAEHLDRDRRCAIAGPRLMLQGTPGRLNSLGLNVTRAGEAWDEGIGLRVEEWGPLPAVRPVLAVTGSALLVRRDVFERLGGWEELYGWYFEDIDLCLRARAAGWSVAVIPAAVVHHALSATACRDEGLRLYHTFRNRLLLVIVHWPLGLLLALAPRLLLSEGWRLVARVGRGQRLEARSQVRAWLGFLRLLPAALARRRRQGRQREWVALLSPAGPVQALP
jgi:N-acetylglucosaminyl-diphospho-decaprenol L-rhamnosyltransferase